MVSLKPELFGMMPIGPLHSSQYSIHVYQGPRSSKKGFCDIIAIFIEYLTIKIHKLILLQRQI